MNKIQFLKGLNAVDPYTYLLMHMDGVNTGVSFPDSGRFNRTVTASGNVNTSTAQQKFGSASAYFDGKSDYLSGVYADMVLGSGDFTIDFWVYPTSVANSPVLVDTAPIGGSHSVSTNFVFALNTSRNAYLYHNGATVLTTSNAVTLNAWNHIATVRSGTTVSVYINGVSGGSATLSSNLSSTSLVVGTNAVSTSSQTLTGYMDELRVSIGVARWTANFTPSTAPYAV